VSAPIDLETALRLLAYSLLLLTVPVASFAGLSISITIAPPPLPVYVQPICPQAGYLWTPGYWAWSDEGYFWVPGTWVTAPSVGVLWTPGYWGWLGGIYSWNGGYWGSHVGFYGGVNYGFGYGGIGFAGGEWRGGGFFYNTAVMNLGNTHITNVYVNNSVVVNNTVVNHVSFNGGPGGLRSGPTPAEQAAGRDHHIPPTGEQVQQQTAASRNTQLWAKNNGGKPAIAATAKAGDFSASSAVPARAAGGRVEPATLNASAKSMPHAGSAAATPNEPRAATPENRNSPKPQSQAAANGGAKPEMAHRPANVAPQSNAPANASRPAPAAHSNQPRPENARPAAAPEHSHAAEPKPAARTNVPPKPAEKSKPNNEERKK